MLASISAAPSLAVRGIRQRLVWAACLLVIVAIGLLKVVGTYPVLTQTFDEPSHIAAGLELLDRGTYTFEQQHPPLARVAAAIGPYLLGAHFPEEIAQIPDSGYGGLYDAGHQILYQGPRRYIEMLTAARIGELPFLVLLLVGTWYWAWRDFGPVAAVTASLLLATAPPVLAHAGLATNDLALTALLVVTLYLFQSWLETPNRRGALALGLAVGLAVTAKLSALLFLPVSFGAALAVRWYCSGVCWSPARLMPSGLQSLPFGLLAFGLTIWVVYGFPADPFRPVADLWAGIQELRDLNALGHPSFFWGEVRNTGWWLFFPTALLIKTPLPLLLLALFGGFVLIREHRRDWRHLVPLACAACILVAVLPTRINLGVRHVLPMYPLLAILAGAGIASLLRKGALLGGAAALVLVAQQAALCAAAQPDYLSYFNPLAGSRPERLLVGSDLDWGQDTGRAAAGLRDRGIKRIAVAIHGAADLSQLGFPAWTPLEPHRPVAGWIAISLTELSLGSAAPPDDDYRWLERFTPVATIGRTIRLYRIDPAALAGPGGAQPERTGSNFR